VAHPRHCGQAQPDIKPARGEPPPLAGHEIVETGLIGLGYRPTGR